MTPVNWAFSWNQGKIPITKSENSFLGDYAVKGEIIDAGQSTDLAIQVLNATSAGFPVSQRFSGIQGFCSFFPNGGDELWIYVNMIQNNIVAVGSGLCVIDSLTSSYTLFEVPVNYYSSESPTSCDIRIKINSGSDSHTTHPGSYFLLDNLSLIGPTEIKDESVQPENFVLHQNYPNPFNAQTTFSFDLPEPAYVNLTIYNILGNEITTLISGNKNAGRYKIIWNAESLPSGIYLYSFEAGSYRKLGKVILQR